MDEARGTRRRPCLGVNRFLYLAASLGLLMATACGQSGPLTLPEEPAAAPAPPSATPQQEESEEDSDSDER